MARRREVGSLPTERTEIAFRAVNRARGMEDMLTSFARVVANNDDLTVVVDGGPSRTNGKTIYLHPPMALGHNHEHNRLKCSMRDDVSRSQLCPACKQQDEVFSTIFHEIAHITSDSFMSMADRDRATLLAKAVDERPGIAGSRYDKLRKAIAKIGKLDHASYPMVCNIISPYLHPLVNSLEDARVNRAMYQARSGTYSMFYSAAYEVFEYGLEQPDGTIKKWSELAPDSQVIIGLYCVSSGFEYDGWFDPEVVEALHDKKIQTIITGLERARTVGAVYRAAFPLLERLRELGFCKLPEDLEDDPPPPPPEPEEDKPEPKEPTDTDEVESDEACDESDESAEGEGGDDDDDAEESEGEGDDDADTEESEGDAGGDDTEDTDAGDDTDTSDDDDDTEAGEDDGEGDAGADEADDDAEADDTESGADGDESDDDDTDGAPGADGESDDADGDSEADDDDDDEGTDDADDDGTGFGGEGAFREGDDDDVEDIDGTDDEGGDTVDIDRGNPSDAMTDLERFTGHDEDDKPRDMEERLDDAAIERAVEQADNFDEPSDTMYGVRETRFQPGEEMAGIWKHSRGGDPSKLDPPEGLINGSLNKVRIAFAANKKSRRQNGHRSGRVVSNMLPQVMVGNDKVFSRTRNPGRRDYFVCITLDISGSTQSRGRIDVIARMGRALGDLLSRAGVEFAMYAHTGVYHATTMVEATGKRPAYGGVGDRYDLDLYVIKDRHDPWGEKQLRALAAIRPHEMNLDGHTLEYMRKRCDESSATDKLILYVTDGAMPCANPVDETRILKREIKTCEKRGYELIGVAIQNDEPKKYGLKTVRIDTVADLPKIVHEISTRLAVH